MFLRFLALPRAHSRLVLGIALFCIGTAACGKDPKAYISSGDKYAAESKWPEAILEYRNALQALPQDGDLRLKLGEAYAKSGQGRLAAGEFIRAADLLSDSRRHPGSRRKHPADVGPVRRCQGEGGQGAGDRAAQRRRADTSRELARWAQGSELRRRRARRSDQARPGSQQQLHEPRHHRGDTREAGGGGARLQESYRARWEISRRVCRPGKLLLGWRTHQGRRDRARERSFARARERSRAANDGELCYRRRTSRRSRNISAQVGGCHEVARRVNRARGFLHRQEQRVCGTKRVAAADRIGRSGERCQYPARRNGPRDGSQRRGL